MMQEAMPHECEAAPVSPTEQTPRSRRRSTVRAMLVRYQQDENLCRYKNKLCMNPRALKHRGGLHTFCELHREAANRNQRRLDMRKRVQRREVEGQSPRPPLVDPNLSTDDSGDGNPMEMRSKASPTYAQQTSTLSQPVYTSLLSFPAVEPSRTPMVLKDEDLYALRWLFESEEPVKSVYPGPAAIAERIQISVECAPTQVDTSTITWS